MRVVLRFHTRIDTLDSPPDDSLRKASADCTASAACVAERRARTPENRSTGVLSRVGGRGRSVPLDVARPGPSLLPLAPTYISSSSASAALMEALARQERNALSASIASTASVILT